jgi:hypothetical protein
MTQLLGLSTGFIVCKWLILASLSFLKNWKAMPEKKKDLNLLAAAVFRAINGSQGTCHNRVKKLGE